MLNVVSGDGDSTWVAWIDSALQHAQQHCQHSWFPGPVGSAHHHIMSQACVRDPDTCQEARPPFVGTAGLGDDDQLSGQTPDQRAKSTWCSWSSFKNEVSHELREKS